MSEKKPAISDALADQIIALTKRLVETTLILPADALSTARELVMNEFHLLQSTAHDARLQQLVDERNKAIEELKAAQNKIRELQGVKHCVQ